jgi:hypothetical protein
MFCTTWRRWLGTAVAGVRCVARATGARARAALALVTVAVATCVLPVSARTVLLVYDDSGSMRDFDRHVFANYATQNLVALLDPGDRLEVVRMSQRDRWITLLPETNPRAAIEIVSAWPTPGPTPTPYEAVQTATGRLKSLRAESEDDDEDYWLIVFSDGEFNEFEENASRALSTIRFEAEELNRQFSGRKLGVVYLGIGPDAPDHARAWEAAGVTTFLARSPEAIIHAMFDIAALVTGRDPESGESASGLRARFPGDGTVEVTTDLPLRRLVVFHQGSEPLSLRLDQSRSRITDAAGMTANVSVAPPLSARQGPLFSVVNVVSGERLYQVMGPGTFSLALDTDRALLPDSLRFLPDVALDLTVERDGVGDVLCAGDPLRFVARLLEPVAASAVDLERLAGLDIRARSENRAGVRELPFEPFGADAYELVTTVPPGRSTISVIARYPGYFNLRSRLFTVEGIECVTDAAIAVSPARVEVPVRLSPGDERVTDLVLTLDGILRPTEATVHAVGLPPGWMIELAGRRLSTTNPRLEGVPWPADGRLGGQVWRSDAAVPGSSEVTLSITSEDPTLRFARDRASVTLVATAAVFELMPTDLGAIELALTDATTMTEVQRLGLTFRAVGPAVQLAGSETLSLRVAGLPEGVALVVAGVTFAGDDARGQVPLSPALSLSLQRDRRYRAAADADIVLEFASPDPRVLLTNPRAMLRLPVVARPGDFAATTGTVVTLARTTSQTPVREASFGLEVRTDAVHGQVPEPETVRLGIAGLPDGVELEVLGERLRGPDDSVLIDYQGSRVVEVTVLRSSAYDEQDDRVVRLTATSEDPRRTWRNRFVEVTLRPVPRSLELVSRSDPWTVAQDRIAEADRYRLEALVDGVTATPGELATWDVRIVEAPARLRPVLELDAETGSLWLQPRPVCLLGFWCIPGLTPTGALELVVEATAGAGEAARGRAQLTIVRASLWQAWLWPLTQLLLLLAAIVVAIGYVTKVRFPKGSMLCFAREPRPKEHLPGHLLHVDVEPLRFARHRLAWTRWLPFVAERASFDVGFGFTAARMGQVLLTRVSTGEVVWWGSGNIEDELPLSIGQGDVLSIERASTADLYTFTVGSSCSDEEM